MSWFKNPWDPEDGAYGEENASNHGYLASRLNALLKREPRRKKGFEVHFPYGTSILSSQQNSLLSNIGNVLNGSSRPLDVFIQGGAVNIGDDSGAGANLAMERSSAVLFSLGLNPGINTTIEPSASQIATVQNLPQPRSEDFEKLGHNGNYCTVLVISRNGGRLPNAIMLILNPLIRRVEGIRPL